jgi:NitT/TauT family transport system substrate-binding protein
MIRRIHESRWVLTVASVLLLTVLIVPAARPGAQGRVKVRYVRPFPPDVSIAWYYVGLDKGYFRDAGIDTDIVVGTVGSGGALQQVIAGAGEFASGPADAMFNAVSQGGQLVAFWQWIKLGIFGIQARKDRGISRVEDLKGKTIGVLGMASATRYSSLMLLARAGLKESDVNMVVLGGGGAAYGPALSRGQVDALGTWDVPKWVVETTAGDAAFRRQLVYFSADDYLPDVFTTSRTYYDTNKETLVKFLVAMQRANADVARDIDEAVRITTKYLPAVASADPTVNRKTVEIRAMSLSPDGLFDHAAYERALPIYQDVGLVKADPKAFKLREILNNEIPELVKKRMTR